MSSSEGRLRSLHLRMLVTFGAIVVAITHAVWPNIKIDGVTLGLVGLSLLPWLAPIIKSVELPGVGKIELQEVKDQVEELRGETASASQKASTALATRTIFASSAMPLATPPLSEQRILSLAAKYNEIRKSQTPGGLRTGAMTEIVGEMIDLAPSIPSTTALPLLSESDAGKRLFAYAYIYALPKPEVLSALVQSVTQLENKPFGQYWGIQAIGRVIQNYPDSAVPEIQSNLRVFLANLKKGTDRYYELSRIIESAANTH